jgi:hypothetical protein
MADLTNFKPGDSVEVTVILTIKEIADGEGANGRPFTSVTYEPYAGATEYTLELPTENTELAAVTVTAARP